MAIPKKDRAQSDRGLAQSFSSAVSRCKGPAETGGIQRKYTGSSLPRERAAVAVLVVVVPVVAVPVVVAVVVAVVVVAKK